MWWLLIPVIGTVVAAVVSSDSSEKEEAERQARAKSRERADTPRRAATSVTGSFFSVT